MVLQKIESLNDIVNGALERRFEHAPKGEKVFVLPTGEVYDFRGSDGDFGHVKSTEVKNALTKLLHYQQNLAAGPVASIKDQILPLVLDILGCVCSSYTFHTHDPEALDRSLANIGSRLSDPDDLKKYFQVHETSLSMKVDRGRLCVDDSLPPRIVQHALHFNSLLGLLEKSNDKHSRQDKQTHSRQIVRLLQEIIVEESGRMYNDQTFAMSKTEYVESGFDGLPDPCIAIEGDELTARDPKTRYPMGWEEINNKLQQFTLWQKALGDGPEIDLDIIKSHLIPSSYYILQEVCNFLRFLMLDMRSDTPEFRFAHLGIELKFGHLETDSRVSQTARNKIGECNVLLFKLSKEVDKLRLAQFGVMPAAASGPSTIPMPERQPKPSSTTPTQEPESAPATPTTQWHELGKLRIRADFLEVQRGKHKWNLTLNQGKALEFVYKSHRANSSIHQRQVLRHIESPSARLRETLRSKKGLYAALFAKGEEKGHIQLNT